VYKFSSFSSYSVSHGNKKDFTGILIGEEDAKKLASCGFGIGDGVGASGTISVDGTVDLVLSHANPAGTIHSYDADGSLWFNVSPDAIRVNWGNRIERLTRADDVHVSKLTVQVRNGDTHLVSTDRSRFGKSKKRNASTRTRRAGPAESVPGRVTNAPKSLVSYVTKAGDNYALLMSSDVAERVGLAEGSRVEIEPTDDGRIIVSRSKRHFTLDELLAGMAPEREHPLEDDAPRGEETL
jgi:antitoxin component of MazEF toxin-antitoxin module